MHRFSNTQVVLLLVGILAGMSGLVAASVPLYRLFCQATGYGGYTQRADANGAAVSDRLITVRFDAQVNGGLPWAFYPEQKQVTLHIGETGLAFFRAENKSKDRVKGQATFNVTPLTTGQYFNKIQCFCFTEQVLEPGQVVDMPVSFFVDPAILKDPDAAEVDTITLSYTFFRALDDGASEGKARLSSAGTGQGSSLN